MVYEQLVTAGAAQSFHAEVVVATLGLVLVLVEAQSAHVVGSDFLLEELVDDQSAHDEVLEDLVVVVVLLLEAEFQSDQTEEVLEALAGVLEAL